MRTAFRVLVRPARRLSSLVLLRTPHAGVMARRAEDIAQESVVCGYGNAGR